MFAHLLLLFTFCHFPFSNFLLLLYIPTGWTSGQILCQRRRRISKWNMQNSCQVRLCACVYACVCMTIFRGKLLFGKCLFNHFGRLQQKTLTTCVHMTVISWMLVMRRGSKSTKEVFFFILFSKSSFLTAFKEIDCNHSLKRLVRWRIKLCIIDTHARLYQDIIVNTYNSFLHKMGSLLQCKCKSVEKS